MFLKTVINTFKIPVIYLHIAGNLKKQKKFFNEKVYPLLEEYKRINDDYLSEKDFFKIEKYYGLAVPAILGEAFATLRGYDITEDERMASTCQGVITGVFDDFFDEHKLPIKLIQRLIELPKEVISDASNINLFIKFYTKSLEKSSNPGTIIEHCYKVLADQVASVEQVSNEISIVKVIDITKNKGGNSVLFYRSGYDNIPDEKETDCLFELGALMQLENDIFDVYKDSADNIKTLATSTISIESLWNTYSVWMQQFIDKSYQMNYPKVQITNFLDILMPVINRGFVCLNQYKKLEKKSGKFLPKSYTRKQLICDMEKPSNILRAIYYQAVSRY